PHSFEQECISLSLNEPFHFLFLLGDFLKTNFLLDNADYEIAGDIYILKGTPAISYTLPVEEMGNQWSFVFPSIENEWLRFRIRNFREFALFIITDKEGKVLMERQAFHPPSANGRLKITSNGICEILLANLFYRPGIRLTLDKFAYKKGDIAKVQMELPHIGDIGYEVSISTQDGEELKRTSGILRATEEKVEVSFSLSDIKDGVYLVKASLYSNELKIWEGEPQFLIVDDSNARKALQEIEKEERKGMPQNVLVRAKEFFLLGDFRSALSTLRYTRKKKDHKTFCQKRDGEMIISNDYFEIRIKTKDGFGPYFLLDRKNGVVLSDAPYHYFINEKIVGRPRFKDFARRKDKFIFIGEQGDIEIVQEIYLPSDKPYLEEKIRVRNKGNKTISTSNIAFGFLKRLIAPNGKLCSEFANARVVSIPYRRPLQGKMGEYEEFPFEEILWRKGWYRPVWNGPKVYTDELGAEGWAIWGKYHSYLIAKHNNDAMEYSLLKVVQKGKEFLLRFAGGGIWHGDPEAVSELSPGEEFSFGTTHIAVVDGDWKSCYYAFREFMEEKGHTVPPNYNPPIHWNELYDNPLWWGPDTPENRKKHYSLPQILEEAEKAKEMGCEALYLDPGWDTSFASSIWAEDRLLKAEEFVKLMRDRFGLYVALHTPLANWSDVNAYPPECRRRDKEGNLLPSLCGGSEKYIETKARRLIELAKAGVVFFMFDGSAFTGECYDPSHNHPIPYTREAHCRAILKLCQLVHKEFPNVLIELHDPIIAGVPERYAPTYYLHSLPGSFDEVWAFEYMWSPLDDLLSGRAISLYYYNLAYSLPLYIHIDLRKDNENCLEFWWFASTCRHLGVGGKHPDEKVWEAHKNAMKEYKRLKEYFTRGKFFGVDETVHIHSLKGKGAVVNIFNLGENWERKYFSVKLEDIELDPKKEVKIKGANWERHGSRISIWSDVPPRGCCMVEIEEAR
ncbi:MAG: hypothetical protein ACPLPS_09725, partial [bacterium]